MPFLGFLKAITEAGLSCGNIEKTIDLVEKLIVLAEKTESAAKDIIQQDKPSV